MFKKNFDNIKMKSGACCMQGSPTKEIFIVWTILPRIQIFFDCFIFSINLMRVSDAKSDLFLTSNGL